MHTAKAATRERILETALALFSVQGYEATSVAEIASAVGIRKASLYSHFACKQDILDSLLQSIMAHYETHSIFTKADWTNTAFLAEMERLTEDAMIRTILAQVRFILHDPLICRGRKLLTIEQFRNPRLAALQTKQNYTDVMQYFSGLVRFLIGRGALADGDPESMAAELCLPLSVWINLCDREPEREDDVMALAERHLAQFFLRNRPPEPNKTA